MITHCQSYLFTYLLSSPLKIVHYYHCYQMSKEYDVRCFLVDNLCFTEALEVSFVPHNGDKVVMFYNISSSITIIIIIIIIIIVFIIISSSSSSSSSYYCDNFLNPHHCAEVESGRHPVHKTRAGERGQKFQHARCQGGEGHRKMPGRAGEDTAGKHGGKLSLISDDDDDDVNTVNLSEILINIIIGIPVTLSLPFALSLLS